MLITKDKAEIPALIQSLRALPIEGKDLNEIIYREYTRQVAIDRLEANAVIPIATHSTDTPTIVIDSYWGMRLGIIKG